MSEAASRRLLQVAVAIGGLVPVGAGAGGMLLGGQFLELGGPNIGALDHAANAAADSHIRYLSGLLFGIGIAFWTAIPGIERHASRFLLLTGIVVAGGLARLAGVLVEGWPGPAMGFGLAMELVVTPAICLWQRQVAGSSRQGATPP